MNDKKAYARKYYLMNRERLKAASRQWRLDNPDKSVARSKRRHLENTGNSQPCECGCGGYPVVNSSRFIRGHSSWKGGKYTDPRGYVSLYRPAHPRAMGNGRVYEHVEMAERVLGRYLPDGAVVHHVNEKKGDNRNDNLVICQDDAYHFLLHARQKASAATGNSESRKCFICKCWDLPSSLTNLRTRQSVWYHSHCARELMMKANWKRKKGGHHGTVAK